MPWGCRKLLYNNNIPTIPICSNIFQRDIMRGSSAHHARLIRAHARLIRASCADEARILGHFGTFWDILGHFGTWCADVRGWARMCADVRGWAAHDVTLEYIGTYWNCRYVVVVEESFYSTCLGVVANCSTTTTYLQFQYVRATQGYPFPVIFHDLLLGERSFGTQDYQATTCCGIQSSYLVVCFFLKWQLKFLLRV